jgi:hypothetical protein
MSPVAHKKKKERLALALRIERVNCEAVPCSYCRSQSRRCLISRPDSSRCSECIRSKRSCDSPGPRAPPEPRRVVCRFFHGPKRPPAERAASVPPSPWFPAFELDAFLDSVDFAGVATADDPLLASFWEAFGSSEGTASGGSDS